MTLPMYVYPVGLLVMTLLILLAIVLGQYSRTHRMVFCVEDTWMFSMYGKPYYYILDHQRGLIRHEDRSLHESLTSGCMCDTRVAPSELDYLSEDHKTLTKIPGYILIHVYSVVPPPNEESKT